MNAARYTGFGTLQPRNVVFDAIVEDISASALVDGRIDAFGVGTDS